MDTYISKPADPALLFAAVEHELPRQGRGTASPPSDPLAEFAAEGGPGRG